MTEPCNLARNLSKSFADLFNQVTELKVKVSNQQINNMVLAERIYALEEKERQRDRDEWDRELNLDSGPPDYIPTNTEKEGRE